MQAGRSAIESGAMFQSGSGAISSVMHLNKFAPEQNRIRLYSLQIALKPSPQTCEPGHKGIDLGVGACAAIQVLMLSINTSIAATLETIVCSTVSFVPSHYSAISLASVLSR